MNNISRYIVLFIIMVMVGFSSCEDYLTVPPENELIKERYWKKTEDVNGVLAAMYDAFRDGALESFIWGELRADIAEFGDNNFGAYNNIAASDISSTNSVINWSNYYKAINLANTLMYYDKQVYELDETFTKEMLDAVDAEALFIRSLSFFYLVRIWKDVPLTIEASISDTSNLYIPKSSEKEVIHQIINDLLKAKDMAYTTEFDGAGKPGYFKGRANKFAIMALLADVYLWDEQYENCLSYCDSVIGSGLFSLEPTETWFRLYYPGNSRNESIFEIQFDDNLDDQQNPMYDNMLPAQLSLQRLNYSNVMSPEDLRNCNPSAPNNPRPIWKYLGKDVSSPITRFGTERDANFIYYRFADILLMKADALTELNRLGEAGNYLKITAERAGIITGNITTQDAMRIAVLDERAREFVLEGKRWFDLLRVAKREDFKYKQIIISMILSGADVKQQAILKTKVFDTLSYYLPIPEHELQFNQNLVQNPYYDR